LQGNGILITRQWNIAVGWILTILMGLFIIIGGVFTIIGNEQVNQIFQSANLSHMQITVGMDKIISTILFLIPATFVIGVLLLSAFWGGTIVTHLTLGDPIIFKSVLLIITWIIYVLRKSMQFIR